MLMDIEMEEECKQMVKTKVLSIVGTEDFVFPPDGAPILERCIPQHEMFHIEGAEHYFVDPEHLQTLMDKCVAFLS